MSKQSPVDVLIVGGSYAGLTTALTLCRQLHTAIVFDSGDYRNGGAAHGHSLPTWDHKDPHEFRAAAKKEIETNYRTTQFKQLFVNSVQALADGTFEATTDSGNYYGKKLVLATGAHDVQPDIPGYSECWPKAIFHCLFCHGYEERHAKSSGIFTEGMLGTNLQMLAHVIGNALQLTPDKVTVYTHGDIEYAKQVESTFAASPAVHVNSKKVTKFEKLPKDAELAIHFADGSRAEEGFLAHAPALSLKSNIPTQLQLETNPMGFVTCNPPFNTTNVPGVFVAGDASTMFKFSTAGLYTGALAAAGVAGALQAEKLGAKFP